MAITMTKSLTSVGANGARRFFAPTQQQPETKSEASEIGETIPAQGKISVNRQKNWIKRVHPVRARVDGSFGVVREPVEMVVATSVTHAPCAIGSPQLALAEVSQPNTVLRLLVLSGFFRQSLACEIDNFSSSLKRFLGHRANRCIEMHPSD